MAARILKLPVDRMHGCDTRPVATSNQLASQVERLRFWRGASGRCYPYTAYRLIECPPVTAATYVMMKRREAGPVKVLRVGHVRHAAETLNLAELRHIGASVGADEIHLHFPGEAADVLAVELDMKAARQDGMPAASAG